MKAGGGSTPGLPFFSLDERAAVAALLLLKSPPPSPPPPLLRDPLHPPPSPSPSPPGRPFCSPPSSGVRKEDEEPAPSSSSTSSSSSSCVSDSSRALAAIAKAVQEDRLCLLAWAARCLDLKRKVVRKARSVVLYSSIRTKDMNKDWGAQLRQQGKQQLEEDPAASCLSSTSTAAALGGTVSFPTSSFSGSPSPPSSPQVAPSGSGHGGGSFSQPSPPASPVSAGTFSSHGGGRGMVMRMRRVEGKYVVVGDSSDSVAIVCGSNGLRRRAKAILEFLRTRGSTSEVRIRAALGDSPDTSKALRMLVKLDQVRRAGTGGRRDPFLYWISGPAGGRIPRTSAQLGTGAPVPP